MRFDTRQMTDLKRFGTQDAQPPITLGYDSSGAKGNLDMNTFNGQPSVKASLGWPARLSAVLSSGRTRSKMIKATFILAAALAALPAMAETITFTISAQGSGILQTTTGPTTFTDQLITFTEVTDTSNITNPCLGS